MIYWQNEELVIRDMEEADGPVFVEELTAQGWHPDIEDYRARLKDRAEGESTALTAVYRGQPAGYVYLYRTVREGPFKGKGWLMDAAEQVAGQYADTVCLGVGVCDSYGSAQRLYVKRGYIPDGSGVWYRDRQCVQYETVCTVDDDLVLFLYKKLQEERTGKEN